AAGQATGRTDWQEEAESLAVAAARRDVAEAGVKDCGICHGAAGLGHLFNRLFQGTGHPELAEAARFWIGHALDLRKPEGRYGGFQSWSFPRGQMGVGDLCWVDDPGLLSGSSGVGLCLLAAVEASEPEWDRSLMISAA
ncbi:MAG: hypothetical protein MI919_02775, partial [Holophagales bacterium]|nr:hypothetical protein [Holophagales bacterium]